MDILTVRGKHYPQKVVLDSNIVTISGELFASGTEIFVLLCERLVLCQDTRGRVATQKFDSTDKIYFLPESQELITDIHCRGKTYQNVEELCKDRPRFFSCQNEFFTVDTKDCAVMVAAGQECELKKVESMEKCSISRAQEVYHNVSIPTTISYILHCHCKDNDSTLLVPSTCKSTFIALDDPNVYKAKELLDNVELPRKVKIYDDNIYRTGSPYLRSNFVCLESRTNNYFLLFTKEYPVSEQLSVIQLRHQVRCCELTNPSAIKVRTRIDNSQIGECFQTIFIFEHVQNGQTLFSVLGRKDSVPVSRLQTGRQAYIPMEFSKDASPVNQKSSADSGFDEPKRKGSGLSKENISSEILHEDEDYENVPRVDESSEDEDYENVPKVDESSEDDGEYVAIELKRDKTPPVPERKYLKEEDTKLLSQVEVDNNTELTESEIHKTISSDPISVKHDKHPEEPGDAYNINKQQQNVVEEIKERDSRRTDDSREEFEINNPAKGNEQQNNIQIMSSSELAEFLKKCKLNTLADVCLDEGIDGELFLELDDDMLKDEPFQLNRFEIVKVNKIKRGWSLRH